MAARRVLVPLVVVALALTLFYWRGCGTAPIVDLPNDVNRCAANLRQIYTGLLLLSVREKRAPRLSGVAMFGELIASGVLEDTPANRAALTCPGSGAAPVSNDIDWRDPEALTATDSAYAARDNVAFPLGAKFPLGGFELEPLVGCDNAQGLNHVGCMNVLYSDGSVKTFVLAQEIERGRLPPDAKTIPVGKDSPIPDLQKLAAD